jgi:hypothetical protein
MFCGMQIAINYLDNLHKLLFQKGGKKSKSCGKERETNIIIAITFKI